MKKNLKSKSAVSMILVAAIIVIIVVAGAAGAYYYMTQPSTSPSPSPSPTGTATPTASPSVTATPAASASPTSSPSTNPIANFKAGAYAIYNTTTYTDGVATVTGLNFTIGEDTYNGTACWTLTTTASNDTSNVVIIERISKSNTSELLGNVTMKMYSDGSLIYEDEFDPTTTSATGTGTTEIDPQTIVGYETVTVAAGTFADCAKASVTSTTATSETEVSTVWISQNIPAFGIVKAESTINGTLSSIVELLSYGGYP